MSENKTIDWLWPELTEAETKLIDQETVTILERRARVMGLYRAGKSMGTIAKELNLGYGTVHADIHVVLNGYRRLALRSMHDKLADFLQQLAHREQQIEQAWIQSGQDQIENLVERREGPSSSQGGTAVFQKTVIKKRNGNRDVMYAGLLLKCLELRAKYLGLVGLEAGERLSPPHKLVAGVNPLDVV